MKQLYKQIYLFGDHDPTTWTNGWEADYNKEHPRENFLDLSTSAQKITTSAEKTNILSAMGLVISSDNKQALTLARSFSEQICFPRIKHGIINALLHKRTLVPDEEDQDILVMVDKSEATISLLHHSIENLPTNTNILIIAAPRTVQLMVNNFFKIGKINTAFEAMNCPGVKITLDDQRQGRQISTLQPHVPEPELI